MPVTSVEAATSVILSKARPLDLDIWRIPAIALLTRVEAKRTNGGGKRAKKLAKEGMAVSTAWE